MQYKMVVRRTMFDFDLLEKGSVKLRSVHFLGHSTMKQQNDLLLVTENDTVQFFLNGATPMAHLSREQFKFVSAASRYFAICLTRNNCLSGYGQEVWIYPRIFRSPRAVHGNCSRNRPVADENLLPGKKQADQRDTVCPADISI